MDQRTSWSDSESRRAAQPAPESLTVETPCHRSCTLRASLPKDRARQDRAPAQTSLTNWQTGKRKRRWKAGECSCFSLVSSFPFQLERLWYFAPAVFVFTVRDRHDAAVTYERAVEGDRSDLRQRFVFDTVADNLIVNPDNCGKGTNGEWTTLNGNAPGSINCNLLSADLDVQTSWQP